MGEETFGVRPVAREVDVDEQTVQKCADKGLIKSWRDSRNRRRFTRESIAQLKKLYGREEPREEVVEETVEKVTEVLEETE